MHKKGLIGKLMFLVIIIILVMLLASAGFFFKLKEAKFEVGAGDVILDFDYNKSEENPIKNETNTTERIEEIKEIDINTTENNITSYDNISADENERPNTEE